MWLAFRWVRYGVQRQGLKCEAGQAVSQYLGGLRTVVVEGDREVVGPL
jgi:hypothetical protein